MEIDTASDDAPSNSIGMDSRSSLANFDDMYSPYTADAAADRSELAKWKYRCQIMEKTLNDERRKNEDLIAKLERWWSEGSRSLEELIDGCESSAGSDIEYE